MFKRNKTTMIPQLDVPEDKIFDSILEYKENQQLDEPKDMDFPLPKPEDTYLKINEILEKNYSSVSNFKPKKAPGSAIQNEKTTNNDVESVNNKDEGGKNENNNNNTKIGTVLPAIKSSKNKERIERLKLKNEDDGKINEINDMMSKIMDEF